MANEVISPALSLNNKNIESNTDGAILDITSVGNAKRILDATSKLTEYAGPISLAGVPEDVLPDVEDQAPENQKLFMRYFSKNTENLSEDEKIDFGFDLADTLMMLQKVPAKTIKYAQEFQDTYNVDLSEIISLAESKKVILDKEDAIRENELEKLAESNRKLAESNSELTRDIKKLKQSQIIIDRLFEQLGTETGAKSKDNNP